VGGRHLRESSKPGTDTPGEELEQRKPSPDFYGGLRQGSKGIDPTQSVHLIVHIYLVKGKKDDDHIVCENARATTRRFSSLLLAAGMDFAVLNCQGLNHDDLSSGITNPNPKISTTSMPQTCCTCISEPSTFFLARLRLVLESSCSSCSSLSALAES
jgi:hypothetical protein